MKYPCLILLAWLSLASVYAQNYSLPGVACPGGRLVPSGFAGNFYQFITDTVRIGTNEEGAPQLLVQYYQGEGGPAGTILHVFLDTGPAVPSAHLDSIARAHQPGGRYAGRIPFGLMSGNARIPCTLLRERGGQTDTLVSEHLPAGGDKLILAARLEGLVDLMFREAQATYPKQRLLISLWLPTVTGAPTREYIHDLSATLASLKNSDR